MRQQDSHLNLSVCMLAIPVKLGHTEIKKELQTLAMFDSQEKHVNQDLKQKVGITSRKTEITITTLNGK